MEFARIWAYVLPVIEALGILLLGWIGMRLLSKLLTRSFEHAELDLSLARFLKKAVKIAGYAIIFTCALTALGVSTTGVFAALSGCTIAIGVALKDSLSNVAGGILLLLSPRFMTGDYIEAGGSEGSVISVDLLHTTIQTSDCKQVSIPNGALINGQIVNYTVAKKRRVDIDFPIAYEADVETAKRVATETILRHPMTMREPAAPFVRVTSYGDSAVNLTARVWCATDDYWTLKLDLLEQVRAAFDQNGISIPYNQLDVRIREK